jgi:hypothetical protein
VAESLSDDMGRGPFAEGAVDDPEPFIADVERKIVGPLDPVGAGPRESA